MLKCGHTFLLHCITKLFNKVLIYGSFPKLWSKGFIVPLFKSGSKDDPANYRGICIGSCLGKLFLKVLNNRLENFISKRNLKCDEQIGFCRGKRTSDHMFILKTLIEKYTKQGVKHLYTCFIDFKKAFDKVWHIGLFFKLREMGVSDLFYNVLKNMYLNTELCVKASPDTLTDFFPSEIGVRQGDNLSPTLFKIFVNDLPGIFKEGCSPVSLLDNKLNCLLYADDLLLLSESPDGLQTCINRLSEYCDKWGLEINIKKSKVLIFNNTGKLSNSQFVYKNVKLENIKKYTYLGVTFTASGTFSDAKQDLTKKGLKALFKVKKMF